MRRRFERKVWLDPATYGADHECSMRSIDMNMEIDKSWWDLWTANVNANMKHSENRRWVTRLYNSKNGTSVVCGAGPSLLRNIEVVREFQSHGVTIIAVDRAYRKLTDNGIQPDIVVTMDAQEHVKLMFEDLPIRKGQQIVYSVITHPAVVDLIESAGAKTILSAPMNPFSPFWIMAYKRYGEKMATTKTGYIITFSAVDIAYWMGHTQILTFGNELSWQKGTEGSIEKFYRDEKLIDIDGTNLITLTTFAQAAETFLLFPALHRDCKFVDASGGLTKQGWGHICFEEPAA